MLTVQYHQKFLKSNQVKLSCYFTESYFKYFKISHKGKAELAIQDKLSIANYRI